MDGLRLTEAVRCCSFRGGLMLVWEVFDLDRPWVEHSEVESVRVILTSIVFGVLSTCSL